MPSLTIPEVPRYVPAAPTKEQLEYADLAVIDLAKGSMPEDRAELAKEVRDAMTTQGFFYAINHGYSQAQTERIFNIADLAFSGVSEAEKREYSDKENDTFEGYKPRQFWKIEPGVSDQVEHYNIHRDVRGREHPKALRPLLPEIEEFAHHNHYNILNPILRLLALGLELPEETLVKRHLYDMRHETSIRFMKYYPRTDDEEQKAKNVWLKGHTDSGSVTVLWSQPVAALQILSNDGKWRWIKHIPNALVINCGDAIEFLSGGYFKATIHRVIQPPVDQRNHTRLGVFYFAKPDDDLKLAPYVESPVLQRVGIKRQCPDEDAPTMEQWRKGRTSTYGRTTDLKKSAETGHEEEVIHGVVVKHYN